MSDATPLKTSLVPAQRLHAQLLLESGYIWMEMGQLEKAREVFSGAAALLPKSEVPQIALGTLELAQGHHDKALKAYRAAQKLAPANSLPRAHAGEALLFLGKSKEALRELKAAVALGEDSDGGRLAKALIDASEAGAFAKVKAKPG